MSNKLFKVYLSAVSDVQTSVEVNAENPEQAAELAVKEARSGNVDWDDGEVDDSTIEVDEVQIHAN